MFVNTIVFRITRIAAVLMVAIPAYADETQAGGKSFNDYVKFHDITSACSGECGFQIYAGRFVKTGMRSAFGLDKFIPVWDWKWSDSGIVAAAFSRPVVSIPGYAEMEAEAGLGQRFGNATSTEAWAALFFRWKWFPWNRFVRTSIGVSTGLNYAFKIDDIELIRSGNGEGSKLLHFLTPEIALSLPSRPDRELVFRFHHRSGGKEFWGDSKIFNSTYGGAHYLTAGFRFRY